MHIFNFTNVRDINITFSSKDTAELTIKHTNGGSDTIVINKETAIYFGEKLYEAAQHILKIKERCKHG